ncbi:hypothetical protein FS842_000971 [Serendipita sp. 407]|nr:hypothetical protein FS842_000971 [Serendipita sp. 407]
MLVLQNKGTSLEDLSKYKKRGFEYVEAEKVVLDALVALHRKRPVLLNADPCWIPSPPPCLARLQKQLAILLLYHHRESTFKLQKKN